MKTGRLEQLSDGIFAIVMTVLVFELRIPPFYPSNPMLLEALKSMAPIFLSYVLAFAMLFNYWRAHHFFISVYAKNIDTRLTSINALFFFFVSLVPFSASLLGQSGAYLELPIIIFSLNTIALGIVLFWMRDYVFRSPTIKNLEVEHHEIIRGTIRTFIPIIFALIAIPLSFYSRYFALGLLTISIIFNFSHASTHLFNKFLRK